MFAHSCNFAGTRHDLVEHLQAVARTAWRFGIAFNGSGPAYYAGLWHDLGKFNPSFQMYLERCDANPHTREHGPEHKGAGAVLAWRHCQPVSMLIQGHHGGLRSGIDARKWVKQRASDPVVLAAIEAAQRMVPELEPATPISIPSTLGDALAAELYLRLLFSALVDADFLDTESHFHPDRTVGRASPDISLDELWARFKRNQNGLPRRAGSIVDEARQAVYRDALAAAELAPGVFRLTVPTGGGKTRSAMAFALRHALKHGMKRVIVAAPYTSITEQTAQVYREIFGADAHGREVVLEHYSQALAAEDDDGDFRRQQAAARLAAENWDAPIVVTTTVQLFESLFSNATSRLRKAHRMAGSVIVLDEAQTLPPRLLDPITDAIRHLTTWAGTTLVLSTATQPAFDALKPFADLSPVEIAAEPAHWFDVLKRVEYEWRGDEAMPWEDAARHFREERQGLAVVNLKKDAAALLDALDDADALHLSTNLCGAHRRRVIEQVRERLQRGEPCRLVSTQVVEAGVDLDFPYVMRAMGPLDAVIQAAGRCNREGKLERGRMLVFRPEGDGTPPGLYRTATDVALSMLSGGASLEDAGTALEYFRRLYGTVSTDAARIQERREHFDYPETAQRFRMIEDETESVVIADYGTEQEQRRVDCDIRALRDGEGSRYHLRRLQPYVVAVYRSKANELRRKGLIEPLAEGIGVWRGRYDAVRGLVETGVDPDQLVV
ncbi:MAG: CRISPR-associated helicase Cas3' [Chloroflexota bacterium]|nr:CRISPR-associated helicase Cas3' [Chloroflexota bacterium]